MSLLLDLQVEISARPPDASSDSAAPMTLHCGALKLHLEGEMFSYPLTKQERDDLRWYLEEYWRWPFAGFAARGSSIEQMLPILGQRLYQAVFGHGAASDIIQQWRAERGDTHQISILTSDAGFLSLPWELLHDGQDFLTLQTDPPISIVRRIAKEEQPEPLEASFEKPLRVLMVTSRPVDAGQIDVRTIAREVLDALQDQIEAGAIEIEFLRPPTMEQLQERLSDQKHPVHILHFDGHGKYNQYPVGQEHEGMKGGQLLFETDASRGTKGDPVDAESLGEMLGYAGVRVVVLNACQSATIGEKDNISSSMAIGLLLGTMQAVVAMSASVLATSAALYVKAFYGTLATGGAVQTAHEQALQALHEHPERHPLQRHPDEAGTPFNLQDWWLPYLYLQRPLALHPVSAAPESRQPLATAVPPRANDGTPILSSYAFIGRSAELLQIERFLLRLGIVVVSGFGGVGKTALVREAATWLTHTQMYDETCFVSFEHGGDASLLLSALGEVLAVNNGSYHAYDPPAALTILAPLLKQRRILVIADNVESVLPGGDAALDDTGREQLWETLIQLQHNGAGVLITSRSPALDERRLTNWTVAYYLKLGALTFDDAYALAWQVLNANHIDPALVPYAELYDLLIQLDRHPLAIQLTLPALRVLPLAKLRVDFASLLSTFEDDQTTGRNRSLLASLDYSLQRLSDKQRTLLPRLAPFEGGALELNLLNVTEMSQDEWKDLQQALQQAGLLVQEQTFAGIKAPFQHFHPVLVPYLRGLPGADDAVLRERFVTNYYQFAYFLSIREQGQQGQDKQANKRQGEIMRKWASVEFPNLRRSLELLLNGKDVGLITAEADILTRFLDYFGRRRERDTLRRAVLEAIRPDGTQSGEILPWAVYWQEKSLGEQELEQGDWQAATQRFQTLLFAMNTMPEGEELGHHSLAHATILQRLERALKAGGLLDEADARLQEALIITSELLEHGKAQQQTEVLYVRGTLLVDSGDILRYLGQYAQAKQAYEEGLLIATNANDQRGQAVALAQLGSLALAQKDFVGAINQYNDARILLEKLGEKALLATVLHQMGMASSDLALTIHTRRVTYAGSPLPPVLSVESEQAVLTDAEQAYRESLKLREQLGDDVEAAGTCFQLGILAERVCRYAEAKDWYTRAQAMYERAAPGSHALMVCLNGLAHLLINADYPDRMAHLAEAHHDAVQALQMAEKLPIEDETWTLYRVRATIAELEGQFGEAEAYWQREREVYAEFPPHRAEIDQIYGAFIANIVAAVKGDEQARALVNVELVPFDANEQMQPVAASIRRILAGERDWHALSKKIVPHNALVLGRVLESLGVTPFA
jgi:tetratricopeptide (TPR) repeat protein